MKKKILTILCLFLVCLTGFSQDNKRLIEIESQLELLKINTPGLGEALNINITQATLSNFLLAISKVHKLNISVAPELNNINIVNNFSDVDVKDVLVFLVKSYQLDIDFTGNILSIGKFKEVPKKDNSFSVDYNASTQLITLDIGNSFLDEVFRTIMDTSGKNLLFSPDIQKKRLTLYIKDVPLDVALNKLASTNDLTLSKSRDGFYMFDLGYGDISQNNGEAPPNIRPRRNRSRNFYYKVLDTLNRKIEVDFQNTNIADVIYTIGDDLKLDVFTATPLDNIGTATVKARNIDFDNLLDIIFQSIRSPTTSSNGRGDTRNQVAITPSSFTYKKEDNIYFIGTENQLSLKQIELVQMYNRAVNKLKDPRRSTQRNRNQGFVTGSSNVFSGNQGQNGFNNPRGPLSNDTGSIDTDLESINTLFPQDILEGLQITTDFELNGFVVSGPGVKVERFKKFIQEIDKVVPVILIEVMIMEVNRTALVETGISFGLNDRPTTTQGVVFPDAAISLGSETVNKIIGGFNGFGSLNIGKVLPEFYLDIQAKEANGDIKILSTPKLTAINGHKAYLSSSNTTYYAVTFQNIIGTQNPQTNEIRNYVPITAELALEIIPFVSADGQITLDIQVIQSSFSGERIEQDAPPDINTREFSSIVRMKDQDVAVLGGIEQKIKDDSGSGIPLLARVPILKYLFSKRRREDTKRNLSVLIKPTVIN